MSSEVLSDYEIPPPLPTQHDANYKDPYTMTEEILTKRLNKRYHGRCITQFYAGLLSCIGSMIFGFALGWSSPAFDIVSETQDAHEVHYSFSWIASMVPLGICIGVIAWSYLVIKFGPRKCLLVQSLFLTITWVTLGTKDTNKHLYMACRFFCGFFSISYKICGEVLLLDSIDVGYMRDCIVFFRSFTFLGVLLMYIGGTIVHERYFAYMPTVLVFVYASMLFFAPESPVFLFTQNEKKAIKALRWYRGRINMASELKNIKRNVDIRKVDPESHKYMLYSKVVTKGILIVIGLMAFQVFTGYYAFIFFNMMIWQKYGGYYFNPYTDTVIYGCCLFFSCMISTRVHYSVPFGVRKPLLISIALLAVSLSLIVVYCFLWEWEWEYIHYAEWFPLLAVNMTVVSYEMGLSILPDTIIFDYMPYQVYPRAKSIVKCVHWFFVFLLTKLFSGVSTTLYKFSYIFMVNFAFAIIGFFYILIFVIETKNQPLVHIQLQIGGNPIGNRSIYRQQRLSRM